MRLLSILFFLFFAAALSFYSCNPLPNGGIPFYMRMDSVIFNTTYATQGANTQNFTDVWVTSGPNTLGAFQLPINFPVLLSGPTTFVVSAGVQEDGDPNTRVIYPMTRIDTFTINAVPGQKYSHRPSYQYLPGVSFLFHPEDFELGNDYTPTGSTGLSYFNLPDSLYYLYGHKCGVMTTTATDSAITVSQNLPPYTLTLGDEVWVELDYKCDVPFFVGLNAYFNGTSYPTQVPILFVNVSPTWNKVYISLTSTIGTVEADSYTLYFQAVRPLGTQGGNVYLDNIKMIEI